MADIDEARWRNERQQLTKAMQGVRDDVEAAECRIGDVQAKVAGNEQRQATMHAEVAKRFADLQRQIDVLAEMGVRCQDQIGWTAQAQVSIEHEMRVAVAECNEMLGGHEAVIRALRDGGSPTRYQPLQTLFDQLPQEHEQLQQKRESRGDSGVSPSLHHDNNNHSGGMAARGESLDDIFAHDAGLQPALGLYHHHQPAPSATLHHNDSASHQADAAALVSSSTATATTAASGFPSPPMSASGEPELSPLAEFVAKASTLPRKAASVIGTNLRRPTRRAVSTHVCRRSASDDEQQQQRHQSLQPLPPMSPTRPAALDGLISRAAHVGVGWGNYWQARQHKLEIDIQKRLGVPANAIRATSDDVVVD
ncbi:hypothetical protein FBU59_005158 [Linderina macrospora]|uniref:Uncharacterized protein n=1 Tax=Linderina macrospora TaxID=4868 RepID=A0ACC1J3P0_9FUNG|nr:hypothetical protein FBU59_005158 [Linderina macrospora]